MNSNEYQELAARTLIDGPEQPLTQEEVHMLEALLSLHVKLGKVTEQYKKAVLHRHASISWSNFCLDMKALSLSLSDLVDVAISGTSYGTGSLSDGNTMVLWNVIGLLGESSEIADVLLQWALNPLPDAHFEHEAQEEWTKELGDVSWYLAAIATKLGLKLSDIQQANVDKLKKRFPEGFSTEASKNRVDVDRNPVKKLSDVVARAERGLDGKVTITEG